ncbi:flagellar protein MotY [Simiduia aestuariiviva]|uniref:Outer membrane protein OmpA-like peptidoglycan-associated protein n=1 Tax=Simiduia aestuariiviva TaxID=1510459 RepID=A0A839UV53_9GAMM|nr:OmpA family protein [Simiduia aestuariiviva]MBB3169358.1 outer membrane protein OmpA-like peptidoglycan-associated protein [Simiduia aestuariiviva]
MAVQSTWRQRLLSLCAALSMAGTAAATEYTPPMDQSIWTVSSSIFACELRQTVPFYGEAGFYHRAGEQLAMQLRSDTPRLKSGKARLTARAPVWRPKMSNIDLGLVPVTQGLQPVRLDSRLSNRALTELHAGRELVVTRYPWYGAQESSRIALSPINFQAAYQQYLKCLAGLLPVNYDQIARTSVYFPSSGDDFPGAEKRKLRHIAIYTLADPKVSHLFIDGHTDSKGLREDNLALSKRRAESVQQFLISQGIPEDKLTVRWHGERYPVTSNESRKGRAQNRRVTVRVDRIEVPDLAANP